MAHQQGRVRYDVDLINYWQRNKADQRYTWYMAMAYAISTSKIDLKELDEFKKNYREGSTYQNYV
jgi:ABC-type sulfate transport system substrate-binding protein